jgi:glycerophosphoryl diester phosphodiesterase
MKRLWFLCCLACLSSCGAAMKIVAHRGASFLAPENTLASVKLAWELQADAVEVDVYLTPDKRIVVIHDETTLRTSGQDHQVAESRAEVLRDLDVGGLKAKKYAGEKIPFIEEVLATVPPGKKLFVEIKCGPEILPYLRGMLTDSGKKSQVIVISFDYDVAVGFKALQPDVPVLFLKTTDKDEKGGRLVFKKELVEKALAGGLDGLGVHHEGVTREFAQAVKDAGLELYVWTVDDPLEARRLMELGTDWLATNRPGWMREQLRGE